MTDRRGLVETAYHEAGHALASIDLDFPFIEAVIKLDGSGSVGPGVRLPRYWGHGRDRVEDQIVMFAAGPLAETRLTGRTSRSLNSLTESLFPRNNWSAIKLRYDALEPKTDLDWLIGRSRVLVVRRWREIEFVASSLVERSRLTSAEVLEKIERAITAKPDHSDKT